MGGNWLHKLLKGNELIFPSLAIVSVFMMVIPVPTALLDAFIALSLASGLVVILMTMFVGEPLEFSVFPTLILMFTIFRLALNISTTRSILWKADAGSIIDTFGSFVTGGNLVVGLVIFLILVAINFIVIAHGAQRIGEVAARFTLDAMPGKQIAIDSDLSNGLIDEEQARARRKNLEMEADYYGAMDGASRFIQRDAIAGILITVINIVAGFIIGMTQKGMEAGQSLETYTTLTVGDGLVSQIPALLMSVATGIMVTNAAGDQNVSQNLLRQLGAQPKVLAFAGTAMLILMLVPGFPKLVFLVGGLALMWMGKVSQEGISAKQEEVDRGEEQLELKGVEAAIPHLEVDPMEIEIGWALIPLVDADQEGDLLERIDLLRKQMAMDMGFLVPTIRIRDNIQLGPNEYVVKIRGNEIDRTEVHADKLLAIAPAGQETTQELEGHPAREPAFGLNSVWIEADLKSKAEALGYSVIEPSAVLATHLTQVVKRESHELLDRETLALILEKLKETHPKLVQEIDDGKTVGITELQKVLKKLLLKQVPIRDMVSIIESMLDVGPKVNRDIELMTEHVRSSLSRVISRMATSSDGQAHCITIDPQLEDYIASSLQQTGQGAFPVVDPQVYEQVAGDLKAAIAGAEAKNLGPVLLVSPRVRLALERLFERNFPELPIISFTELANDLEINIFHVLRFEQGVAAGG